MRRKSLHLRRLTGTDAYAAMCWPGLIMKNACLVDKVGIGAVSQWSQVELIKA